MWRRGLKHELQSIAAPLVVASHVEAWIETGANMTDSDTALVSPPMWRRGLKLHIIYCTVPQRPVASHVEAWIETSVISISRTVCIVASHVEAWIETPRVRCHPNRAKVASHVEAWIETLANENQPISDEVASHVEAWIETQDERSDRRRPESPPMWRRGLKLLLLYYRHIKAKVASHVEAWIETTNYAVGITTFPSPPMWRRGLKRLSPWLLALLRSGRLPCGGVD